MTTPRPSLATFLAILVALAAISSPARAADSGQAQIVEFQLHEAGDNKKIVLTLTPDKIRIEQPEDSFAAIYNAADEKFTGLELRDATWWEFSWPKVQAAIQKSARYERRLHNLNIEGLASYDLERSDPQETLPDAPVYQWKPTGQKRTISPWKAAQWIGESATAPPVEAWCIEQELPGLKPSLDQIKKINEPMALVPVRPVLPAIVFLVVDSLFKAQVTPIEILWGPAHDRNRLTLIKLESKNIDSKSFTVPGTYRKVQLNALDGIMEINDRDAKNQPLR